MYEESERIGFVFSRIWFCKGLWVAAWGFLFKVFAFGTKTC